MVLADAGGEGPPQLKVAFEILEELPGSPNQRNWRVQVTTTGMDPESEISRYASFDFGEPHGGIPSYTLDNTTEGDFKMKLSVESSFSEPGTFTGSVILAVDQVPETKSIKLNVYSSPNWRRWIGFLAIPAGVILLILVGVCAKKK